MKEAAGSKRVSIAQLARWFALCPGQEGEPKAINKQEAPDLDAHLAPQFCEGLRLLGLIMIVTKVALGKEGLLSQFSLLPRFAPIDAYFDLPSKYIGFLFDLGYMDSLLQFQNMVDTEQ